MCDWRRRFFLKSDGTPFDPQGDNDPTAAGAQSINGTFLLIGQTDVPYIYHVHPMRDGAGFCQRRVDVYQQQEDTATETLMFTSTCSFKTPEKPGSHEQSARFDVDKYDAVLKGRSVESWPDAPGVDSPL